MNGKLLCCTDSVVALVKRKPIKRKKKHIANYSTNSAGCKILNDDLEESIWENSIDSIGDKKAKVQGFLLYGDPLLRSESSAVCAGL